MMKFFKVSLAIAATLAVLGLLYLGVRLVPGAVVFAMARDLALEAGLDTYAAMAAALVAGFIPAVFLLWRGVTWRKVGMLALAIPLAFSAYFAAKSYLRNRPGIVSNPDAVRWFANDGRALLFYARQPDGVIIFGDRPGFHYRTGHLLQPVTAEIYQEWRQLQAKQSAGEDAKAALAEQLARQAAEAEEQRKALDAQIRAAEDKLRAEKEARAETERKLEQQAEEALAAATKLAREAQEVGAKRKELEAQARAAEDSLRQQSEARLKSEQEIQRRAEEALAGAARIQMEVEDAKRQLKEQLAQRANELGQMTQGVETRLRAAEDRLREEREAKSKSELQKELHDANSLAKQIRREAQEQRRRAEKAEAAAASRNQAASIPPPPSQNSTVTVSIRNQTRFKLYVTFSTTHNRGWPEPGRAWVVTAGQTVSISLGGYSGDPVFYHARAEENPYVQWEQNAAIATCGGANPPMLCLVEGRY